MNKEAISKFARDVRTSLSRHSPAILMGIGIAGMVTTTVVAVKATPKALRLIEEKKQELDVESLTPVETVKATWKCYIPAAVTGAVSIACLIGSNSVNTKRNAALATAYKLSETIRRAENILNKEINTDPFDAGRTVNDFYEEIGIPTTATGDALRWNLNTGLIDIYLSYQGGDEGTEFEDEPCAVLNFTNPPRYDFL